MVAESNTRTLSDSTFEGSDRVASVAISVLYEEEGMRLLGEQSRMDDVDGESQAILNFREASRVLERTRPSGDALSAALEEWFDPAIVHEMRRAADSILGDTTVPRMPMPRALRRGDAVAIAFIALARGEKAAAHGTAEGWLGANGTTLPAAVAGLEALHRLVGATAAALQNPGPSASEREFTIAPHKREALATLDLTSYPAALRHVARLTIYACSRLVRKGVREPGAR